MPGIVLLAVSVVFIARQGACDKIFREYNELSLLCYGNLDKLLGLFEILLWLKLLNLNLHNGNVTLHRNLTCVWSSPGRLLASPLSRNPPPSPTDTISTTSTTSTTSPLQLPHKLYHTPVGTPIPPSRFLDNIQGNTIHLLTY